MVIRSRGRLTNSTLNGVTGDPTNLTTTYTRDNTSKVTLVTKPLGNATSLVYDSNNNLINTILLDSSANQHDQLVNAYDSMSRLTGTSRESCTTPAATCSAWTTPYQDTRTLTGLDQLQSLTYPSVGGNTSYTYDGTGNLASKTLGDGSYTTTNGFAYDQQHDPTNHILGGSALAQNYDLQFNRSTVSPTNAVATSYQYDDFGRIEKRVSPFTGTTTYSYDPAGNLTSTTDGNGATTATTYDADNRPLQAVSTRSGYTTETVTWTYDNTTSGAFGIGRLASMTDPSGSTNYTYERHGSLASQVQVANGTTYTTSYTYDGNDNRATITLPSTRVLTYTYDYADRPASVVAGSTTYVSSASYEPFGPLDQLVFGNGTTQTRTFNQRYLLSEDKVTNSTATLADQTFTYNDAGFVTGITDNVTSGYNQSMTYGGRATNMLTGVQSGSSLWGLAQYADTYNQNLSTIAITGNSYGLQYNRAGQLTSIFNPSTNTSQSVTEDGAGNELTVGSSSYTYSSRNHLASGDGVSYLYDGFGRRVSATVSGTGTRVSLYDPNMHLQTESSLSSGSIAYDYIWFGDIPVAQEDIGGNTHWTVTDYRGAPYMQTDSSAAVYWQADYAPFGAVYALRTSDAHQPLRLPGQEAEEFTTGNANGYTGRFYNGYRWYRPLIGRYTQADPIDYSGGLMSLYTYAANNPLAFIDPFGLIPPTPGVYVGYHLISQLGGLPIGHAFYLIVGNDGTVHTVSGEPSQPANASGNLNSVPDADLVGKNDPNGGIPGDVNYLDNYIPLTPPNGETAEELGNAIIKAGDYYRENSDNCYRYEATARNAPNSNSFYVSIAHALGLTLPSFGAVDFPGDSIILPSEKFGLTPPDLIDKALP